MISKNENGDQIPITVLMTVYNEKRYLAEAIESILNQTFRQFEFLIISEYGADEETLKILNQYAQKDSRISIIQNERNLGLAASLNKGLKIAKGKYIARMDSDDISVPNRLKWQYKYMEEHPEIVVSGGNIRYLHGNKLTRYTQRYLGKADQIRMSMLFLCGFSHPTVIINKELLHQYGYEYDERIKTEDYELWSRIVYQHPTANVGRTLLYYRFHDGNSVTIKKDEVARSTMLVQQRILNQYGSEIQLKNQILEGAYNLEQLEELESALYLLLSTNQNVFNNKFVFRNRMDVVYRNTEQHIHVTLHKKRRYWEKFGALYERNRHFQMGIDWILYTIKDVLWKLR